MVNHLDFDYSLENKCYGQKKEAAKERKWYNAYGDGYENDVPNDETHNAYMLVYDKKKKAPFKIHIQPELIDKIVENKLEKNEVLPECF